MQEDSLSYKTLRNSGYYTVSYLIPIVFSIFITPVIVKKLGVSEYGIYILANTVTSFLVLLDLGLSIAVVKYSAEYFAKRDWFSMGRLMGSAYSLFFTIGLLGLIAFAAVGKWFLFLFKISEQSQSHIFVVFILAGFVFFFNSFTTVYGAVLTSLQRYDISSKIGVVNSAVSTFGTLAIVLLGYRLKAIMLFNVVVVAVMFFIYRYYAKKILPEITISFLWIKEEISKAYKFGLQASVSHIASSLLYYFDRLLIPIFLGPASLSYYSLPGSVAQRASGITNSLSVMILPMASALSATESEEKIQGVYQKIFRNLTIIAASVTAAIVLAANKILLYWLGPDFAQKGTEVLIILAITYFVLSLYTPLHGFLLGVGRVKFLIYNSLTMAVINLGLLYILMPKYGIVGAAWAYLLAVLPVGFMFYWAESKYLKISGILPFYLKLYGKLVITAALFVLIAKYTLVAWIHNFTSLVIFGPMLVILYILIFFFLGFTEAEDRQLISGFVLKFLRFRK